MDMRTSIRYFVVCSAFLLQILITHDVIAQSIAVEAGENNINLVYESADVDDDDSPLRLDGQFLYSKQNNHQDLFTSVGFAAFTGGTNRIELGAGVRIIAADPLDYYLTAMAVGVELAYRPATTPKFKFKTSLYYAGEALTFSNGENVAFLMVNMDYEIASDTFIRLGYRRIKVELNNDLTTDFDRGAYLGLLWAYK